MYVIRWREVQAPEYHIVVCSTSLKTVAAEADINLQSTTIEQAEKGAKLSSQDSWRKTF
jgi:hypothetical protein